MLTLAIGLSVASVAIVFVVFAVLKRGLGGGSGVEIDSYEAQIALAEKDVEALVLRSKNFGSGAQLSTLKKQHEDALALIAREKQNLIDIEAKLDALQKTVEEKERQQQEVKSSKETDEEKLQSLMVGYTDTSNDSFQLEKKLAQSLKNLEVIQSEIVLTQEQKGALDQLLAAMTEAGARLRDLLTEYQIVHERLQTLIQQHADLEEEYTKLVEQQLGE